MAHFAKINENNIVTEVLVADEDFIKSGALGDPKQWIQTSYRTWHGIHPDNKPLRKNFASVGFKYDLVRDAFIPPKPNDNYILNEETCDWELEIKESQ